MSPDETHELQEAHARGKWGFQSPIVNTSGLAVLTTETPAWMARPWTVQLNTHRWPANIIQPQANYPPDNQTAWPPAIGAMAANTPNEVGYYARVEFGTDGALERARVDYPWTGCSFEVNASSVRVYVESPDFSGGVFHNVPTSGPIVSGTLSPWSSSRGNGQLTNAPTFTYWMVLDNSGVQQIDVPIPPRAFGYRVYIRTQFTPNAATQPNLVIQQTTLQGVVNMAQDITPPALLGQQEEWASPGYAATRARVYPLEPFAQRLLIDWDGGLSPVPMGISFLLDLG